MQAKTFVKFLTCLKSLTREDLTIIILRRNLCSRSVYLVKISLVHQSQENVVVGKAEKDFEVARKIKTSGKDSTIF